MKLLSIIIPIYNVEPFVEKCLRSLLIQDFPCNDYEIICINDGSPDNSREIVLRLQKEFPNIILIDQENQGVSRARNIGVENANGKYLLFIDPDDFVKENSLYHILKETESKGAQVAIAGYSYLDSSGKVIDNKIFGDNEERILTGMEAYYLLREKRPIVADSSVGIFFEADFLNKNCLRYVPGVILFQDVEILARIHCLADRCIIMKQTLYIAVARPGSATHSNQLSTENVRNGFILAANNLKKFEKIQTLSEEQKLFLNGPIAQFLLLSVNSGIRTKSINIFIKTINTLKMEGFGKLKLEGCKGYHLICGKAYNYSPYLGALVLVLYLKFDNWYNSLILKKRRF